MILTRGRILDPANRVDSTGVVQVDEATGKIAQVALEGETINLAPGEAVIDCGGLIIAPGLIDIHVHLREPGQEYKEDIVSGTRAAASGGFTSVACMPNTRPVIDNASIVRDLIRKADEAQSARVYVIGAFAKGMENRELSEMGDLKDAGIVAVSDDAFEVQNGGFLRRAMEYARMLDLPVLTHCEDTDITDGGAMNEGYTASVLGIKGLPPEAYESHVARNCLLSLLTGAHLHVLHVSTAREVDLIRYFKARGARVTAETAPHYWCLTDDSCRGYNTNAKMNPPLRSRADCNAIIEGLRDRTLDCIATDHAPHAAYEKAVEFALAPFGIVGLETSLALGLTHLVGPGHLHLTDLIRAMSTAPAQILNLPGGTLSVGANADITVFDPDARFTVGDDTFRGKCRNSPFYGHELTGKVALTIVGGKVVFEA